MNAASVLCRFRWRIVASRPSYIGMAMLAPAFLGGCIDVRIPDPAVRYIAFGDSSTSGPSDRDYPDILRERLGEAPETFTNQGEGGETTEEGRQRLAELLSAELFPNAQILLYWEAAGDITEFIKDHDRFLLLAPGAADYPFSSVLASRLDQTQANIESAIDTARASGLTVYVATYFFLDETLSQCPAMPLNVILAAQAQNANAYLVRLNERIRDAAASAGATLVDVASLDSLLRSDSANYFNCNHLSARGNEIVADLFFEVMVDP